MATVMITGASRGIGLGLVQEYLARGDQVIAACRNPSVDSLKSIDSDRLRTVAIDVSDNLSIEQAAASLGDVPIDILVNNAGVGGGQQQSLHTIEPEAWLQVLRINTLSPLFVTRAMLPGLKRATNAKVMVISSQLGAISYPSIRLYAYESSKAAVNKVVKGLAADLHDIGVGVFAIHPGWVKTDMGGPNAAISVKECTTGLVATFDKLTLANSGSFWQWNGTEHAW